jgi:hypothetical protein
MGLKRLRGLGGREIMAQLAIKIEKGGSARKPKKTVRS